MNRIATLSVFAIAGAMSGWAASRLTLAFAPVCGYDCESQTFGTSVAATGGCLIGFVLIGHLFTRRARLTITYVLMTASSLSTATLLVARGHYVAERRARYEDAEAARPVTTNFDFMYMAIATREVQTYGNASQGDLTPPARFLNGNGVR
ncbi:hypothetical protein DIE19_21030 [Burkholderia sp. Bp9126]|nr:hypothetical protein DIE19_21030 [Burkholderia sp. Bp9126]